MTLAQHLSGDGPKHILALDGGGVRGILTLAYLEQVEQVLRDHYGAGDDFRLCDHFALIGGTSTGSIIATGLALGFRVSQLIELYRSLSRDAFGKARWLGGIVAPKFAAAPLLHAIDTQVGRLTLGSDRLRCGLGIIAKRLDTHSVWVFHNHPRGPYYGPDDRTGLTYTANRDLLLANIIRASTAAPTYFEPEFIEVAKGVRGVFVDGGVSPHNNPSLALLQLATLEGYGFRWPTGSRRLHVLSVGTGAVNARLEGRISEKTSAANLALMALKSLMVDSDSLVQTMMQWLGEARNPQKIDGEIGDLAGDQLGSEPQFAYARYNVRFERAWLENHLGRPFADKTLRDLSRMDQPAFVDDLLQIGRESARIQVKIGDLLCAPA